MGNGTQEGCTQQKAQGSGQSSDDEEEEEAVSPWMSPGGAGGCQAVTPPEHGAHTRL